ncbi:ADP-ribosylation factor guanine nucleotide-exchange factor [Cyanidiococcus yangmingshanensis]|uniref:ADP-ribosylation factor guanine nucleotide-exchange factor n=1 Tax=Cyanidiococcus yangmingshanensis TaxID=2690220 RepID=A0A7J7ILU7_9RHOD|nr:ADP-ribosylation factor guanine nucleotide-exchange factor [Cyanidiococcus yangmingshanensis]
MLNTDLHSPHIRRKMTLEDFIRNNRGINDGADLPRELLVDIYTSIQAEELRLSDTRSGQWGSHDFRYPAAMHPGEQQRAALFKEESERLLAQTRELFAQRRQQPPGFGRHSEAR